MALMLDPSVLLSPETFGIVAEESPENRGTLYIPSGLLSALEPAVPPASVRRFFRALPARRPEAAEFYGAVRTWVVETEGVRSYTLPEDVAGDWVGADLLRALTVDVRDPVLAQILREEWFFLHQESWIAARARSTFDAFIRGGGVAVEASREHFDRLAARTLRLQPAAAPPSPLRPGQRIRAASKWIAGAGSPWLGFIDPYLAASFGSAAYFFWLFDP